MFQHNLPQHKGADVALDIELERQQAWASLATLYDDVIHLPPGDYDAMNGCFLAAQPPEQSGRQIVKVKKKPVRKRTRRKS